MLGKMKLYETLKGSWQDSQLVDDACSGVSQFCKGWAERIQTKMWVMQTVHRFRLPWNDEDSISIHFNPICSTPDDPDHVLPDLDLLNQVENGISIDLLIDPYG